MTTPIPTEPAAAGGIHGAFAALLRRLEEITPDDARGHRGDRGAMAALRRGLGRDPGFSAERCQVVAPFVPHNASPRQEQAMYAVASLYALHPHNTAIDGYRRDRCLGATLARIRFREGGDEDQGVVRRFILALEADRSNLPERLRSLLTLLDARGNGARIDYWQLFHDVLTWEDDDHRVQRDWASAFWRHARAAEAGDDRDDPTRADEPADTTDN